jgi:hypothetical protein
MATPTYEQGNTIRARCIFRDWSEETVLGDPIDPTSVVVNTYTAEFVPMIVEAVPLSDEVGSYYYDWTLPSEGGNWYIEFVGDIDGKPSVERFKVKTKWDVVE